MRDVNLLITITKRSDTEEFIKFYNKNDIAVIYTMVADGTARLRTLNLLGLEQTEKAVHFLIASGEKTRFLFRRLETRMQIDMPDRGVALAIPITSIGGARTMEYYLNGQEITERTETDMSAYKYELILTVLNKGYTDMVMDAARAAGAGGGTVIHAKGTGAKVAKKFFGVTLADEKEIVLIVANSSNKKDIMRAIMKQAGPGTEAHALTVSLPVSETAGFRLLEEDMEAQEE